MKLLKHCETLIKHCETLAKQCETLRVTESNDSCHWCNNHIHSVWCAISALCVVMLAGVSSDCNIGETSSMWNTVTNMYNMDIFSSPAYTLGKLLYITNLRLIKKICKIWKNCNSSHNFCTFFSIGYNSFSCKNTEKVQFFFSKFWIVFRFQPLQYRIFSPLQQHHSLLFAVWKHNWTFHVYIDVQSSAYT